MSDQTDIKRFLRYIENQSSIEKNKDGSISINKSVIISLKTKSFPIKIDSAYGSFDCNNCGLITLEGSPKYVNGSFGCTRNVITTLKGGPIEVNGSYFCSATHIRNLNGCPEKIRGSLFCNSNKFLYDIIKLPEGCTALYISDICPIKSIFDIFCHSTHIAGGNKFEFTGNKDIEDPHSKINPKYLVMYLNDYEVIRENKISKYRFNQMLEEITGNKMEFNFTKSIISKFYELIP